MNTIKLFKGEHDGSKLDAGMQVVSFSRKSTAKNPVKEENAKRYVIIPQYPGILAGEDGAEVSNHNVLHTALLEVIATTATNILQANFIDSGEKLEEMDADLLDWQHVLAEMERKQVGGRLNGEMIAVWYDASKTCKVNATRYNEVAGLTDADKVRKVKVLREKYMSLASNNPSIAPEQAIALLAYLQEKDAGSTIYKSIAAKLAPLCTPKNKAEEL